MFFKKLKKILRLIKLLLIYVFKIKPSDFFNDKYFSGKKVIIIGPAETAMQFSNPVEIDDFDLIIRINKSPLMLEKNGNSERTDILYHCMNEDPITGGGEIRPSILIKQNIKFILYPYRDLSLFKDFFEMKDRYPNLKIKAATSFLKYMKLRKSLNVRIPTTGIQAINHIIDTDFEKLYITGFTFFRTAYKKNYIAENYRDSKSAYELAKSSGNHDPDKEFEYFFDIINKKNSQKIILDSYLEKYKF
ncbi:hypothetical protein EST55_04570 [Idiomarina sp. 29L]|uniref:hypothetical protein n=1 Tax=Idiomarina sp. 29L TaxID=2508877 RepID=UPI0010120162|nr:hypothetical protein [Idiomarina sp. 29L]RXS43030.1 hypothetical protein EST55_04570 [Idiomarina sp. 29L]